MLQPVEIIRSLGVKHPGNGRNSVMREFTSANISIMLKPEDAWTAIESQLSAPTPVIKPRRSAVGQVLAKDLRATLNVPAQDVSAMDGYVVSDPPEGTGSLPVAFTIAAGDAPGATLAPRSAARIMTGAPVPEGGERVIPVENTDGGVQTVTIQDPGSAGQHIRKQGEVTEPTT